MIAVVGGGISGLALGHELTHAGADVVVLEASPRPGGVIHSVRVGDRVLDLGPQRTRLTPPVRRLVEALGLSDQLLRAPDLPLLMYAGGRLHPVPFDLRTALSSGLLRPRDRLRGLLEPLTGGLRRGETAAEYFVRKFGRGAYERLLGPLFGGLYATDPADMHGRHALAGMLHALGIEGSLLRALVRGSRSRSAAPAFAFRGGLQTLTDALATALGPRLRLGTPARSIERDADRLRVLTDGDSITVDHVVLACPPGAAATLLRTLAPEASARIGRLRVNPLAVVHVESELELRAQGYQVAMDVELASHGATSQHALFDRRGLYAVFLGGARRPDVPGLSDQELERLAVAEFRLVTGADARTLHVHRTAMPAWDRSWEALDGLVLPPGVSVCANWRGRAGVTGRIVEGLREAAALTGAAAVRRPGRRPVPAG